VIDAPVLANGRLELRWYLREQALSRVVHRYGNLMTFALAMDNTRSINQE
jgi:RHH-type proline utilization regulon transcriptional repressor/proline dehydrogenase/delta 1-pyrroline-5-carboxylate dehydrogenase